MKNSVMIKTGVAGACLLAALSLPSNAGIWDRQTTINLPRTEVPGGTILEPGKYMFRMVDPPTSNRHVVQITNPRENHLYATVIAFNIERPAGQTKDVFTFYEMPAGEPQALKAWFYGGYNIGLEFAYPQKRALEIAQASHTIVPPDNTRVAETTTTTKSEDVFVAKAEPAPTPEPAPVAEPQNNTTPEPAPVAAAPVADQSTTTNSSNTDTALNNDTSTNTTTNTESLPKTGTNVIPLAGFGFLTLIAAGTLGRISQRRLQ